MFRNVGLINVAEQVSRLAVSNAQGYMLDIPTQKIARDERSKKLRPNLMLAMFFGQLEDRVLIVSVADESQLGSRTGRTFLGNAPVVQLIFDIQGNVREVVQAVVSLMVVVYEGYSKDSP